MFTMFKKKTTTAYVSSLVEEINQEILDHKLNIIELKGRISTLQEKKALLMSIDTHEVIRSDVEVQVQNQELPAT